MVHQMTSTTNNRSMFTELFRRRVPQILAIYGAGCWTVVQIVEWIINRYLISPHLTDLCLIGMLSFIPSIALIAYFHGTPGSDKWHPIEKIGIPLNIFASVLILFITFYPKDLGAITETIVIEDQLGNTVERVIPKAEFRKKITIFNFRNLSEDEESEWMKWGLAYGVTHDNLDELILSFQKGNYHYLAREKEYKPNDELPLNLMLDIAKQNKTKYLLFGEYTQDDSGYIVSTYLYNSITSRLLKERSYENRNIFTMIDKISYDLKIDLEIPHNYLKTSKDLPFSEINTKSLNAYIESCQAIYFKNINLYLKAEEHLNRALEYDKRFAMAYRQLFYVSRSLNQEFEKTAYYSNMCLNNMYNLPEKMQQSIKLSHAKRVEKNNNKVINILEKIIQLNPDDLEARIRLSEAYGRALLFDKALSQIEYCYSKDPSADYLLQFIFTYRSNRDYNKALKYANEYTMKYPNDDLGYLHTAVLYQQKGNYKKAKENWYNSLIVDPEYLGAELLVYFYSYVLKEISSDQLIEKYHYKMEQSISDEDKGEICWYLSEYYSVHGQVDSSIYYANRSLQLLENQFSPRTVVWTNLRLIPNYIYIGRYDLAKNIYEQYGKTGQVKDEHSTIGWLMMHENKIVEAKEWVNNKIERKIMEGNLSSLSKYYFLNGLISLKENEYQDAIIEFKKVLNNNPWVERYFSMSIVAGEDVAVYLLLSQAYFQLHDTEAALEWALKAYGISPFEPHIQYQMALVVNEAGNHEEAMQYLEYCLDIWKHADKDFAPAMEAKQKWTEWNEVN